MARLQPLADLIGSALDPALAAQGFTGQDLVASWPEIVGERLAGFCRPVKVEWPRRRPGEAAASDPARLVVRVESAFALELQHMAPVLVERINAVYGWRCIGRIVLKQGPVGRETRRARAIPPLPTADDCRRVAAATTPVEDAALREALTRLGHAVAAGGPALSRSR
ncbi:DUF721 domain-containing protein [Enterovirga rhinocerotis]|uniref:DUF721 domain-containing protein n=1 Tax=Enterovirga rhinocerotis TaxID=1339210 RepID=A0A4R7CAF5_9HYPH|nr:DciA family protein [Enterovirga rhinocerotis]TDR93777.1 hypothetical protein EV668_1044 [Enterovirga rhinocerotis]